MIVMKPTLTILTALLLAPLVANAQQPASPATVRDHLWLFAYPSDGDANGDARPLPTALT